MRWTCLPGPDKTKRHDCNAYADRDEPRTTQLFFAGSNIGYNEGKDCSADQTSNVSAIINCRDRKSDEEIDRNHRNDSAAKTSSKGSRKLVTVLVAKNCEHA